MKTVEIFRENVYMTKASSKVLSYEDGLLVLEGSLFFPEGGGQSSDKGKIQGSDVMDVWTKDSVIYHKIDGSFKAGQEVEMEIDWAHRFDNMQRHSGEHILTGIFFKLYGAINRGFHMGDDYMTIDLEMDRPLTFDMVKEAELEANQIIWQNMPFFSMYFDTLKEAKKVPVRKEVVVEEDITLVGIGSEDAGWGCCACCGTHVTHAGDVGLIKAFKVEPNKGMYRVYFEAGKRAFLKYQKELDVLDKLGTKLSAGTDDLLEKYEASQDKVKDVKNHLHNVTKFATSLEAKDILNAMDTKVYMRKYDLLSIDDILAIGRSLIPELKGLLCLAHTPSNTVLLFSNGDIDCGKLVKENAGIYGGKGGGGKDNARAIFNKSEYVDTFVDLLDKHLR
ncbi:MAG: alanyl-tRNA editing protein [Clostridia bacterium]|nr:alanyl-tRNA editing protein [Clostridia bacterium]